MTAFVYRNAADSMPEEPPDGLGLEFLAILQPEVEAGNPYAITTAARLTAADDIDAEAVAVLDEWAETVQRVAGYINEVGRSLDRIGIALMATETGDEAVADLCWRCDAAKGEGRLGLCGPCLTDLRHPEA